MDQIKNDKPDKKDVISFIIVFAIISILVIVAIIFSREQTHRSEEIINSRFEVEVSEPIELQYTPHHYLYVVTDRETDVQYLIISDNNGVGITTMRDTNGMVLLRE